MRCDGECVVVVIVGERKVRGEETQKKRMLEARLLCTSSGPRGCQWQPVDSGSGGDSDSNIRDNQSNNRC